MQTGWVNIQDELTYFSEDGKAASGWQEIDGKQYYLDHKGVKVVKRTNVKRMSVMLVTLMVAGAVIGCTPKTNAGITNEAAKEAATTDLNEITAESEKNTTEESVNMATGLGSGTSIDKNNHETEKTKDDNSSDKDDKDTSNSDADKKAQSAPASASNTGNTNSTKPGNTEKTNTTKPGNTEQPTAHTHSWSQPTCTMPATCSCGQTNGAALGHDFGSNNPTCSKCGMANPNYTAQHVHSWVPVTQTINHPAVTHEEDVYREEKVCVEQGWNERVYKYTDIICCCCEYTTRSQDDMRNHVIENKHSQTFTDVYENIYHEPVFQTQTIKETKTVVDQEAWTETIITGQVCSTCGATQ